MQTFELPANIHLLDERRLTYKDDPENYLETDVTDATEILVYLDRGRYSNDELDKK